MTKPLISICMPTYNSAPYLADCMRSILAQTYKPWELVVVNDGSTDSTMELLRFYAQKDSRITVIDQENRGIAASRNEAFRFAKGDYIAIMDSDDVMQKDRLTVAYKALTKTKSDVFYSAYARANEQGVVQDGVLPPKHFSKAKTDVGEILDKQLVPHVCVVATRKCFEEHPYRDEFTSNDDLPLILDFWKADYKFCMSPEPLVLVRYHDQSTSATKDKEVKAFTRKLREEFAPWTLGDEGSKRAA